MFDRFIKNRISKAVETAKVEVMDANTQKDLAESVSDNMIPVIIESTTTAIKREIKKTILPWAIGIAAFSILTYAISHKTIYLKIIR